MEFQDVVRERRMVRAFTAEPLTLEVVDRLLANAQRGPSSGFSQGFEFLVFSGAEETERFWTARDRARAAPESTRPDLRCAPLVIVPFAHERAYVERYLAPDKTAAGRQSGADFPAPYWFVDTGMAALLVLLTAVDAGLGAFYFSLGANRSQIPAFCEAFGIPNSYEPVGAIAVGHPAVDTLSPSRASVRERRRPPAAVLHRGAW